MIPPGATLVFEVQLVNIIDSPPPNHNLFKQIDLNGDNRLSQGEVIESFIRRLVRMKQDGINITDAFIEESKETAINFFKVQDLDHNGFVSHGEFIGPKVNKEFELDRNNYIVLSRYDFGPTTRDPLSTNSAYFILILIVLLIVLNILLSHSRNYSRGISDKLMFELSIAKRKFIRN
jgi:hypothetical protein